MSHSVILRGVLTTFFGLSGCSSASSSESLTTRFFLGGGVESADASGWPVSAMARFLRGAFGRGLGFTCGAFDVLDAPRPRKGGGAEGSYLKTNDLNKRLESQTRRMKYLH